MGNSIVSISLNGKFHLREKKKSLTFLISICCQVQLNGNGWHIPPCHPISTIRMVGEYLMLVQNTSVEERSLFYFKEKWGFDPEFDHVEIKISHLILSRQIFLLDILGKCQGWGGERGQDWDMGQDGRGSKERLHITLIMHFLTWRLSPCRKKKMKWLWYSMKPKQIDDLIHGWWRNSLWGLDLSWTEENLNGICPIHLLNSIKSSAI